MKTIGWLKSIGNRLMMDQSRYLMENTVTGPDVGFKETRAIARALDFDPEEQIEIIWSYTGSYSLKQNIIVAITNLRVFKWENESISDQIPRHAIVRVNHVHYNSLATWDKLQCEMANGGIITFGIFHGPVCRYFCEFLSKGSTSKFNLPKTKYHGMSNLPHWVGSDKSQIPSKINSTKPNSTEINSTKSDSSEINSTKPNSSEINSTEPIAVSSIPIYIPKSKSKTQGSPSVLFQNCSPLGVNKTPVFKNVGTPVIFNVPGLSPKPIIGLGESPAMIFRSDSQKSLSSSSPLSPITTEFIPPHLIKPIVEEIYSSFSP